MQRTAAAHPIAITLIQGLPVTFDPDRQNDQSKECDLPKLEADVDDAVAFQENAANDAEKMSERETLSDHLGPTRHSTKRKHETGEQDRGEKNEESHLHGLQLVLRDRGKGDAHCQVRDDEDKCD